MSDYRKCCFCETAIGKCQMDVFHSYLMMLELNT